MNDESTRTLEAELGFKRLRPAWAKIEIFLGLACVWLSFQVAAFLSGPSDSAVDLTIACGLFVAGGYLAMAGSRSHLYQSNNVLAAYVIARSKTP